MANFEEAVPSPTTVEPLSATEREELARLRKEVRELRGSAGSGGSAPDTSTRWRGYGRSVAAVTLIVLGCLLAPLSVASVWARGEVTDTDRYVQTVAPLADDPAIQDALAANITDTVFRYVDVDGLTTQVFTALSQRDLFPPALAAQIPSLATPVANGIRSFTEGQVTSLVRSDVFAQAWTEANRQAHQQLVAALTGEGNTSVAIDDTGGVRVSMAAFITAVKERLVSRGFTLAQRIPTVDAEFVVFQTADLTKVQRGFDLLNTLGFWLPLICLFLAGLGVYLARDHRKALIGAGIGVVLAALASALALLAVRQAYLNGVPPSVLPSNAAAVLFDTVVANLRDGIRAQALLGAVTAIAAFLTGPSITAHTVRHWSTVPFTGARTALAGAGAPLSDASTWVRGHARALRASAVVAALAVLVLERYRTPELVGWLTVAVLVCLAVIQFFATTPRTSAPAAAPA